ncbi:MAG: hypothetical protein KDD40_11325 [Bdellovibrionales bacterium]|nr:hypothetical protein [Bdellovibrionales bacterium]
MKVLIENLCSGVSNEDLSCLMGNLKGFVGTYLKKDKSGMSEGVGYALFETLLDGRRAILQCNGIKMHGREIKISPITEIPCSVVRGDFWR